MSAPKSVNRVRNYKKFASLIGIVVLLVGTPARALKINLTDIGDTPMSEAQFAAFGAAAKRWEGVFSDGITVNVAVAWEESDDFLYGAAASTYSAKVTHTMFDVRLALIMDTFSTEESQRYAQLIDPLPIIDINGNRTADQVTLTAANAKAIGLYPGIAPYDATIKFNKLYELNYDLDRNDGIDPDQLDFVAIAAHELGHALGFVSSTDLQDDYPNTTHYPTTLDLLRYPSTDNDHNSNEDRMITAGPAEYYDGAMNNVPFSQGKSVVDAYCQSSSGTCQASHWRDDQDSLMDPTPTSGAMGIITVEDAQALDYIGYNRLMISVMGKPIWWGNVSFLSTWCTSCSDSIVKYDLPDFPRPPALRDVKPPFRGANIAMHLGISTKDAGLQKRSATGYARFEFARKNPDPINKELPERDDAGHWELIAMVEQPMAVIPPRLTDFYFESDGENGSKFSFRAAIPKSGLLFNSHLGNYGGFRVSGFVDGFDDGIRGDADANMTLELLMDASGNINKGLNGLSLSIDASREDNEIKIHDFKAFGMREPRNKRIR